MDLNEYLETIVEFDTTNPWGIILTQVVFDSFRKYAIDYIQEPKEKVFDSLYEIVTEYIDEPFKKYIDEIFHDEHFEQFEMRDLCLEFFKHFIKCLDSIIKGETINEDVITDFLDYNIYKYFEIFLSNNKEFWFFPYDYEGELNLDVYETLRLKLIKPTKVIESELINTPIVQIEQTPVKSLTRAIVKKKHRLTKKINSFKACLKTRKLRNK
jgi:hypothetical protein